MSINVFSASRGLLSIATAIAAASSGQVLAQSLDTETGAIETITIVGQATNALITTEQLETYQANDLADVFRLTPSISVGGSVGIAQKIYVRGLEDNKLNITVDGAPQTSTLFHHIGRVTIDPDLLKEVEVQAGAGEATSGAGAIGGAIRFKTKDASDLLGDGQSFGGKFKANHFSNDGTQYSGSLYGNLAENWGLVGYFKQYDSDNMTDGKGDEILGSAADQQFAMIKLSGDIADNQSLSLSYEKRDEEAEFSARPNWVVSEDDALYPSEATRDTLVVNYQASLSDMVNLETTLYNTESSFRGGRFDWLSDIESFGFDIRNTSVLDIHRLTYGIDYRDDRVESGYAIPQPEEDHAEEGSVLGLYAQAHSQVTDSLLLSYGLRYDDYDFQQIILLEDYYGDTITAEAAQVSESEINVNAGLEYSITEALTFGLGYAEASRGKEIGDGFTIDGWLWDRSDAPVASDDLRSEKVSNIETSLEYEKDGLKAKIALFQSDIDDIIYGSTFYSNIGTVVTDGVEAELSYQADNFEVFAGFSSTDSELEPATGLYTIEYDAIPLNGYEYNGLGISRGDTWTLGFNYDLMAGLTTGVNLSYVSGLTIDTLHRDLDFGWVDALHELEKDSYTNVDLFVEWQTTENLVFNLAVNNFFDDLYRDHSSVGDFSDVPGYDLVIGPWESGRDLRLSASYSF